MLQIKAVIILLLILALSEVNAQTEDKFAPEDSGTCGLIYDSTQNRSYYMFPHKMPVYSGGEDAMLEIMRKRLKWPDCCFTGRIYVAFIVEPDGNVTDKRILRSTFTDNAGCDPNKNALELVDYLTDWIPGQCNGENVAVRVILPINFRLK